MSRYVLDASAVLALLQREPGHRRVTKLLAEAAISAVNLCEVAAKLSEKGLLAESLRPDLLALGLQVVPFGEALAFRAAEIRSSTRRLGLSLGDCACLATADAAEAIAVTADTSWERVKVGPRIQLIR